MIIKYSNDFYHSVDQRANDSARIVFDYFFEHFDKDKFKKSIDFGCGSGAWTHALLDRCSTHVRGYDLKESIEIVSKKLYKYSGSRLDLHVVDFFSSQLPGLEKVDLGICLEVVEHLDANTASKLIASISSSCGIVLFSAATPGQGGTGHINEREHSYWLNQFRARGFEVFDFIRPKVQTDKNCARFYALNIFVLVHESIKLNTYLVEDSVDHFRRTHVIGDPRDYRTNMEKIRYFLLKRIPHRLVTKLSIILKT